MNRKTVDESQGIATIPDMARLPISDRCTVRQAAEIIGVSKQRVHAYIDDGRLTFIDNDGRFELLRAQVESLANTERRQGRPKKLATCS